MDPRYQQQQPPQSQPLPQPLPQLQPQSQPQPQQYQQYQQYQQVQQPRQQRPETRKSKSGFSFRSDKTSSSNNSHKRKESLQESAHEKRKNHMSATTKANPNAAISEAQPAALALEKPTISSLQNVRCSDIYGNFISDPDRSNPTRWRMERPLETIKSFELAIDKVYSQRQSSYIQPSPLGGSQSQRSSTYWANSPNGNGDQNGRFSNFSANGGNGTSREELNNNDYGAVPMRHPPRMQSDPSRGYGPGPGPQVLGNTRSKDTLNTGNSTASEQWNNSTNPTSEEGSIERANGVMGAMPGQQYSNYNDNYQAGYSDEESGYGRNNGYPPRQASMGAPTPTGYGGNGGGYYPNQQNGAMIPRVPVKDSRPAPPPKQLIPLSSNSVPNGAVQSVQQKQRSSWIKKRFSRGGK